MQAANSKEGHYRFWYRANVKVSLSGSSIACYYRLVIFSSSCLQPLTEYHPDVSLVSPNPPTHFLCPQRAAVHREAWPHATHAQPHKHNIPQHTTQTYSHKHSILRFPHWSRPRFFTSHERRSHGPQKTHSQTVNGYERERVRVFYSHPSLIWQLPESFAIPVSVATNGVNWHVYMSALHTSFRDSSWTQRPRRAEESAGSFTETRTLERPAICPKPVNPPPVNSHTEASVLHRDRKRERLCMCVVYKKSMQNG